MGGGGKDKNDLNIHVEEGGGLKWLGTEREYNPGQKQRGKRGLWKVFPCKSYLLFAGKPCAHFGGEFCRFPRKG